MTKPMAHGPAPGNLRRNIESRPRPHRFHSPGTLEICERIIGFVTTVMSDGTTRHLHRSSPMRAVDGQRAQPIKPPIRDMRSHLAPEGTQGSGWVEHAVTSLILWARVRFSI